MNSVTINGKTYYGTHSVSISNNTVVIDGEEVDPGEIKNGILHVKVTGTLEKLEAAGSVTCEDVTGDIQAGGSVRAGNVGGTVQTGGSVRCGTVGGNVMAGGSVRHA